MIGLDTNVLVRYLAQDEARLLNHEYIGTEHILLGLLREYEGVAAQVLMSLGAGIKEVLAEVLKRDLGAETRAEVPHFVRPLFEKCSHRPCP